MPESLLLSATFLGLAISAILAWWRGSWLDRGVVAATIINEVASGLLMDRHGFDGVQIGPLTADVLLLAVFVGAAIRQPRISFLILSVLQTAMIGVHFARLIPAPLHGPGYASALYVLTLSEMWILAAGMAARRSRSD